MNVSGYTYRVYKNSFQMPLIYIAKISISFNIFYKPLTKCTLFCSYRLSELDL